MEKSLPERIAAQIRRDYIDTHNAQQGDKMPTVRQLCERYGASKSTVSYALSMLEQQGLIWKRQGSGIRILSEEERTANAKPKTLGFLIPWVRRNELTMDLYEGVEEAASRAGYQLVAGCSGNDYENEKRQIEDMRQAGCEGVVLYPAPRPFSDMTKDYLAREFQDLPIVLVDSAYAAQERTMVVFDNYHAAYHIVEKIIEEGHKRIAYVVRPNPTSPIWNRAGRDRDEAIAEALDVRGIDKNNRLPWATGWRSGDTDTESEEWLRQWKTMPHRPTALIARTDNHAVSLIRAARKLDIRVPDELRIVGYDNLSIGHSVHPPFPTTAPDFNRAGRTAVRALLEEINGQVTTPGRYVLEVPVLWRTKDTATPTS